MANQVDLAHLQAIADAMAGGTNQAVRYVAVKPPSASVGAWPWSGLRATLMSRKLANSVVLKHPRSRSVRLPVAFRTRRTLTVPWGSVQGRPSPRIPIRPRTFLVMTR